MIRDESGVIDLSWILRRRLRTTKKPIYRFERALIPLFLSADQRWIYRILLIYDRLSSSIKKKTKDL